MPISREITVAPIAMERMRLAEPSDLERHNIREALVKIRTAPTSGYEIAFLKPTTYRLDVGRFMIIYRFNDRKVDVGYIGLA